MTFARLSLVVVLAGCGYQSQYVPTVDGRARVLWNDDHLDNNLREVQRTPACDEWVRRAHYPELQPPQLRVDLAPVIWIPPPRLVVVAPPPLAVPVPPRPTFSVGGSSNSLGKEVLAVLMVVAIVVSPIIDVTLAAARPESDQLSAESIDQVNLYNDLARTAGNPCAPY
jgi:hypothetical protein